MSASAACGTGLERPSALHTRKLSSKMMAMRLTPSSRPLVPARALRIAHAHHAPRPLQRLAPPTPKHTRPQPQHAPPRLARTVCCASSSANAPQADGPQFLGISALTWQKVIPLGLMFFGILFNYTLLRNTKVQRALGAAAARHAPATGCARGHCTWVWCGNHPLSQDLGKPAVGHCIHGRLCQGVRFGAT